MSAPTNGAPRLERSMGLWMATALVVGNMVGSGVFLLDSKLLGALVGIALIWLLTFTNAELGRGRGGPRCMSCTIERDDP